MFDGLLDYDVSCIGVECSLIMHMFIILFVLHAVCFMLGNCLLNAFVIFLIVEVLLLMNVLVLFCVLGRLFIAYLIHGFPYICFVLYGGTYFRVHFLKFLVRVYF